MTAALLCIQRAWGQCPQALLQLTVPSLQRMLSVQAAAATAAPQQQDLASSTAAAAALTSPQEVAAAAAGSEGLQPSTSGRTTSSSSSLQQGQQQERLLPSWLPRTSSQAPATYPAQQALQMVKDSARAKFVETVEAHVRLRVNARRGDQMVRGATPLPVNAGRPLRIAVFAEGRAADDARIAGADIIGGQALADQLLEDKGKSIDFDACIATPDMMKVLVKLGRILGPKGLMPNPKMGTLTEKVAAAVQDMRRGRLEFKMDRTGNVHVGLGKVDMPLEHLHLNLGAFCNGIMAAKPAGIKGGLKKLIRSVTVCSSMGKGVRVSVDSLPEAMAAAEAALAGGRTAEPQSQPAKAPE